MIRWLTAAVAVALTVTLVWFAAGPSSQQPDGSPVAASRDDGAEERSDRGREASRGHGPPSWAQGHERGRDTGDKRGWHQAWKAMTPEQREETMARHAREHAAGMRAWSECVSKGRDDCAKPLPPGLAKKQMRP